MKVKIAPERRGKPPFSHRDFAWRGEADDRPRKSRCTVSFPGAGDRKRPSDILRTETAAASDPARHPGASHLYRRPPARTGKVLRSGARIRICPEIGSALFEGPSRHRSGQGLSGE